ncbi:hypothetical protein [Qipengyuania marisflavi]|uniref:HEAT repeat domain-containing protein n=1 Tax=Qipengyuania marisflavi TaxID=2486356 RepID=A0A5S3P922_9SPHN|nr:hypothetical protein [Qipengyuania marisflavi]TMM48944.1 hypothetical protein FEV51_06080 [Qipengyuania marisflavi]
MRIDPEMLALRGDTALQRHAQEALERARDRWLASEPVAGVMAELRAYGQGEKLAHCPALGDLFAGQGREAGWLDPLVHGLTTALRDYPLGQVPLRHQVSDGLSILQLTICGRATLSLIIYEDTAASNAEAPTSICFSDVERREVVVAGAADLRLFEIVQDRGDTAVLDSDPRRVVAREALHFPGFVHAKQVVKVHGRMVMLRLSRTPETPAPSRQFCLNTGKLLHRSSGDRRESQHELMMALLGRMGREDAAPIFAEMMRSGSDHLRWQAMRECLALDTATGFAALCAMAENQADALCDHASALRDQLLARHPQLAGKEAAQCRA